MRIACADKTAGSAGHGQVAVFDLYSGVCSAAKLPRRFYQLGDPASIAWMIITKTATIGVDREWTLS
jgi:hypothetical protein